MKAKINPALVIYWVVSVACFVLISPKWVFAPAAWFGPALLLLFMEKIKTIKSIVLGFASIFIGSLISNYGVMPFPGIYFIIITFTTSLLATVPFAIHKLLSSRISSWAITLAFPCSIVMLEYFNASGEGGGTWGSITYTQINNLPLLQLASVTGIWGISFLISWFSSIAVWVLNHNLQWNTKVKQPVILYAGILLLTLLFGTLKSNPYFYVSKNTVRVAGITASNLGIIKSIYEDAFEKRTSIDLDKLQRAGKLNNTSSELQEMQKGLVAFIEDPSGKKFAHSRALINSFRDTLFAKAAREAKAGAKIISFSEALMFTIKDEEAKFIERGQDLARQNNIYLQLTAATMLPGKITPGRKFMENKSWLINPQGKIVNTFLKNRPVPVAEAGSVKGDGIVPVIQTPIGNLASSICYDADFPSLIRQAGEKNADILILPSGDWKEISPYHAQMAITRAVENGFSLFRTVSGAFSIACDFHGRIIATSNYYDNGGRILIAYLPQQGIKTIYSTIGDSFVALCLAGFLTLVGAAFLKRNKVGH